MTTKLSEELRREIAQNPGQAIPLLDEQTKQIYYVVGEDFLFDGIEHDPASRERLLSLLEEGEQSGEIPKEDAHVRMQATIDKYKVEPHDATSSFVSVT
jgi:hypothetical protein